MIWWMARAMWFGFWKEIDVARIAAEFGGGGHIRAAGFSAKGKVHAIVNKIGELIEQQYNEDNA